MDDRPVQGLDEGAARLRALRREIEAAVLPLATSVDGRRFTFQARLHDLALETGGYVALEDGPVRRLGQVLAVGLATDDALDVGVSVDDGQAAGMDLQGRLRVQLARGEGIILSGDDRAFHGALARPAASWEVQEWLDDVRPRRAGLNVGELLLAAGLPATLDAGGFDRHTFLCGQSGSGKTYALGLILERLLLETALRIVVLDPNSDFVRLRDVRPGADAALAPRYAEVAQAVAVRRAEADGEDRLRLRVGDLEPEARAAMLRLDPVHEREEYAELRTHLDAGAANREPERIVQKLVESGGQDERALALRIRNLGLLDWKVWSRAQGGSVIEALSQSDIRCLVVDLGSMETRQEQALIAEATLAALWRGRTRREPLLIVIDEAHNVCPQHPGDPLTALATQHAIRIAAEGRKFGLYLLLSSQRPQKLHENVLSQCDNLVLMRMNSSADLAYLANVFSAVPPTLLARAAAFGLGQSLVAGKITTHPALMRFGARLSEEGGADVAATWAALRS